MKHSKFQKNPYKKIRKVVNIEALNNMIDHGKAHKIVKRDEKGYFHQINDLVKDLARNPEKKIINIAGPTSSGKTTTAKNVKLALERAGHKATIVSLDDFLLPLTKRKILPNGEIDFESIDTIDKDLFHKFIDDLTKKGKADMPEYDFIAGDRKKEAIPLSFKKGEYIIIEGLHAFNPVLIESFEKHIYKVYICPYKDYYFKHKLVITAQELRLMRRCIRDIYKRGESIDNTLKMWDGIVESEYIYIKPYKFECDYFINSSIDYEIAVYATYLKPLLDQVRDYEATWPLYEGLDKMAKLDMNKVPDHSLLWEFLERKA